MKKEGWERSTVLLTQGEMSKFLQKMNSDPNFSKKVKEILRTGNFTKLAAYLKKSGFKLG